MNGRKIIHIDMDAFFAAVEQRDFPQYRGKPLIVGGAPDSRGVVATCSYEARKFGIHSAMPASQARRLCPQGIFVRPRFDAYREASTIIRSVFLRYTDIMEPVSLDEAYLDVSAAMDFSGSATLLAREIKKHIRAETGLTASAGVSYNKFLAKIASDVNKPDGLYVISPEAGPAFVSKLEVGKFHGVGKATESKMHVHGIYTGADLRKVPLKKLQRYFGKAGQYYYNIARGQDERPVRAHRASKSIGTETTYQQDLENLDEIIKELQRLFAKAFSRVMEKKVQARTVTIKLKYHDFEQITRSRTFDHPVTPELADSTLFRDLLTQSEAGRKKIRLLGVTFSTLENRTGVSDQLQLDLFHNLKS